MDIRVPEKGEIKEKLNNKKQPRKQNFWEIICHQEKIIVL